MHVLSLEVIWFDDDMVELDVTVTNGEFRGRTRFYADYGWAAELAGRLRGFPTNPQDHVEIEVGNWSPEYGGGGIRLSAHMPRQTGRVELCIQLRTCAHLHGVEQRVDLVAQVEPAALDRFCSELLAVSVERGSVATLVQS